MFDVKRLAVHEYCQQLNRGSSAVTIPPKLSNAQFLVRGMLFAFGNNSLRLRKVLFCHFPIQLDRPRFTMARPRLFG